MISDDLERFIDTLAFERIHGVEVEIDVVLPRGWVLEKNSNDYTIRGPANESWEDDIWRIVRFVAYKFFFILRSHASENGRSYELISSGKAGRLFRITFVPSPPCVSD